MADKPILTPQESLALMQKAAENFYSAAIRTNCHSFIEFTGLMNEYIKVCQEFQKDNPEADFRECNAHTGKQLKSYHLDYVLEKLNCIYQRKFN